MDAPSKAGSGANSDSTSQDEWNSTPSSIFAAEGTATIDTVCCADFGPPTSDAVMDRKTGARVAANEESASIINEAWRTDVSLCSATPRIQYTALRYSDEGRLLYGTICAAEATGEESPDKRPGVLVLHTAVGPSDLAVDR